MYEGFAVLEKVKNTIMKPRGGVPGAIDRGVADDAASLKEGFASYNKLPGQRYPLNDGQSEKYDLKNYKPVDTAAWFTADLSSSSGKDDGKGIQQIQNRKEQPIPLPEGEMLLLANNDFSPECCPSSFSNSKGCACLTTGQYNYLINRGGNNIPYSEY